VRRTRPVDVTCVGSSGSTVRPIGGGCLAVEKKLVPRASDLAASLCGEGKKVCRIWLLRYTGKRKNEHASVKKSTPILFREFLSGCQTWRVIKIG
jgi:hypothetical protein